MSLDYALVVGCVLIVGSIISTKLFYKLGIPTLLIFLMLGMVLGENTSPFHVEFDNAELAKEICSLGLVFILFHGGFGLRWQSARPKAVQAVLLSTVGVVLTAIIFGCFAAPILHLDFLQGVLLGAVLASTDAASLFSILKTKKLALKNGLAPLLEMESGTNDAVVYIMTIALIKIIGGEAPGSPLLFGLQLLQQVVVAILIGAAISFFSIFVLRRVRLEIDGLYPILVLALILLCFAGTESLGGSGFLSVYLFGIALGNAKFEHRRSMVHFFDGISWLVQIGLFFLLGLLSRPISMKSVILPGLICVLILIFVVRPVVNTVVLTPFKMHWKSQIFVAWAGLRGAASIVFATFILAEKENPAFDFADEVFNIVFVMCILSILVQGGLIPRFVRKLDLVDEKDSLLKDFNDYPDENLGKLLEVQLYAEHPWVGRTVMDAGIPESILIVMIHRQGKVLTPRGSTEFLNGDCVVLTSGDVKALGELSKTLRAAKRKSLQAG